MREFAIQAGASKFTPTDSFHQTVHDISRHCKICLVIHCYGKVQKVQKVDKNADVLGSYQSE